MTINLVPACPVCGQRGSATQAACGQCGTDLAGYWRQFYRPWHCYNQALAQLAHGRLAAAGREAYAAVVLSPQQPEFRILLSHLLAAAGELEEAIIQAEAADELTPGNGEVEQWLQILMARKYERPKSATPT